MPQRRSRPVSYWRRPAIRTLDKIVETGAFDVEMFRGGAKKNYTKEKTRLQNLMATNGKSADVDTLADESRRADDGHSGAEPEEDLDEFDMVMGEIQERRQWLDDMIALGHGDKYKDAIRAEIASRISKLEQIDRERTRDEEAARFAVPSNNGVGRRGARGVSETNIGGLATAAEEY